MQLQLLGSTIRSTRLARKLSSQGTLIALVSLILQNTALAILLKLSFREGTQPYAPSTAVLCTEVLKLSLSLLIFSHGVFYLVTRFAWVELSAVLFGTQERIHTMEIKKSMNLTTLCRSMVESGFQ